MRAEVRRVLVATAVLITASACNQGADRDLEGVWNLEELTDAQLASLNRDSTIFVVTFGNLEVHGPHLPLGTDQFVALGLRDGFVRGLREVHPEYEIVLFPVVPLGEGAVEELAGHWDHTGSFAVRHETLRSVAIDLGKSIAQKGFRNIFVVHAHGGFHHNIAFSEAAAFVSNRYEARMVNIASHVFAEAFYDPEVMATHLGSDWMDVTGLFHHGGAGETAQILFLRPELVGAAYLDLEPFVARDLGNVFDVSGREEWQGYWGHPAQATAVLGEDLINHLAERAVRIADQVLMGVDVSELPLYPDEFLQFPEARVYFQTLEDRYRRQGLEIEQWFLAREAARP
jgi:creatinine amidohydrolase/Fe(II)-dependent formamide hydrolase-like protein